MSKKEIKRIESEINDIIDDELEGVYQEFLAIINKIQNLHFKTEYNNGDYFNSYSRRAGVEAKKLLLETHDVIYKSFYTEEIY